MDRLLGSFLRGHCRLAVVVARLATVDDAADDHGDHRGDQPGEALLRQGDHVHDLAQAVQIGSHRQNGVAHCLLLQKSIMQFLLFLQVGTREATLSYVPCWKLLLRKELLIPTLVRE